MNRSNIMSLIKSIHKKTPGTGMKDDIPAVIKGRKSAGGMVCSACGGPMAAGGKVCKKCGGKIVKRAEGGPMMGDGGEMADQPAALSEGEYVIDAQTVAMLGDGNTDAGVKILDELVKEIRKLKTGKTKQPAPLGDLIKNAKRG